MLLTPTGRFMDIDKYMALRSLCFQMMFLYVLGPAFLRCRAQGARFCHLGVIHQLDRVGRLCHTRSHQFCP